MNQVYIIGHKKPDTDSICSALAYAAYLNRKDPGKYIAARCGPVNPETAFALKKFGCDAPEYIESVVPSVSDMPFTYTMSALAHLPTIDIADLMTTDDVRNYPLTDDEGRFLGILSEYGLARTYITRQKIGQLSFAPITLENLSRILNGTIVVPSDDLIEGNVYTAIDALHVTLSRLTKNDMAIVGDNEPVQLALIGAGIAALIVADNAPVGERVIRDAKERKVAVLSTSLDAFGVGKMINLSLPARHIMATDCPVITRDTTIEYAKHLVSESRYRTACIVGEDNRYLGMLSRNTFLQDVAKKVILLDHNEYAQAVDGVETAEILEIIDHHRIGAITTLRPIRFFNDPVGSTCTIITEKYMDSGIDPDSRIAGILLSGILSDTLVLRLSTTTEQDHAAVKYLADLTGTDVEEYGTELIRKGMDFGNASMHDMLTADMKAYTLFGKSIAISQVMVPTYEYAETHANEIRKEADSIRSTQNLYMFVALFTSMFEDGSVVFASAPASVLESLELSGGLVTMKGVMSRKNDFIPFLGNLLKNN
ncbi:MAG: putative manganese-dependent inorganic diphosphatase [Methanomicrobiales archaeon]|nr:putative manganese-dependent inorganic diphosphatase [Methanomicrobiales archaeon]